MAVGDQPIIVPLGAGLQSQVDDKLLPMGAAVDIKDAYCLRSGEAVKRFGNVQVATPTNGAWQLATHQRALVDTGVPLQSLASASSGWVSAAGDFRPGIGLSVTPIAGAALTPDICQGGGYYFVLYQDAQSPSTPNLLHIVAVDQATGHRAYSQNISPTGGAASFCAWRMAFVNGYAVACYMDNTGVLFFTAVLAAALTTSTTSAGAVAIGGLYQLNWFDLAVKDATTVSAVFPDGAFNAKAADFVPSTSTVTNWAPRDAAAAVIPLDGAVAWIQDLSGSGKIALATAATAAHLRVHWDIPTAGATRQAATTTTVDGAYTGAGGFITGHTISNSATGDYVLVYDSGTSPNRATVFLLRQGGVTTGGMTVARGAALRSKSWTTGGDYFVLVQWDSATDGTYYVLRVPSIITTTLVAPVHGRVAVRKAVSTDLARLPAVVSLGAGVFVTAIGYNVRFDTSNNVDSRGVELVTFTHPTLPATLGPPKETIGSLLVPGASLGAYDGVQYGEAGFAYAPQPPALTPSAGGGLTASSTYWYSIVYARMDAQGRLWRSAASIPRSVATGVGQGTVTVACPTDRITGYLDISIEIYRGTAGVETVMQKAGVVANSLTVDSVNFVDTMTDTALTPKEILYTNGGVLDNDTPPGFLAICEAQQRTWGISQEDPQVLWYSQEHALGNGVCWSEVLTLDVRDSHGPMRGLATMDDKVIVFKDDATYIIQGAGPDVTGSGGTYTWTVAALGIGCNNAQAICETRDGVMFRSTSSRAGFHMMDRSVTVGYIGAPVQKYNSETIVGCLFASDQLQARFLTASGNTLVYDLASSLWTVFTGQPCRTVTAWNGLQVYRNNNTGHVLLESQTTYTEDSAAYGIDITPPWVQVNGLRGYERFKRIQGVGETVGTHSLMIRLYRDFDATAPFYTATVTPGTLWDWEVRYSKKLAALRVRVTEVPNVTPNAGPKMSALALICRAESGLGKTPYTKRAA